MQDGHEDAIYWWYRAWNSARQTQQR